MFDVNLSSIENAPLVDEYYNLNLAAKYSLILMYIIIVVLGVLGNGTVILAVIKKN